MFYISRNY